MTQVNRLHRALQHAIDAWAKIEEAPKSAEVHIASAISDLAKLATDFVPLAAQAEAIDDCHLLMRLSRPEEFGMTHRDEPDPVNEPA